MLDNGEGAQLLGCDKDWLELAETMVALRIVQSLTFNSLYLHCNSKNHSPLRLGSSKADHKRPKSGQWPNPHPSPKQQDYSSHLLAYELT